MAGRRSWVQIPGVGLVEKTRDNSPERQATDSILWSDRSYEGLTAPDGTDISSRSKHRAYMQSRGLTTIDDFKDQWANAEKARDAYRLHGIGGAVTREDVGRAIHQLENRRR
jgi:hypothetical protein